MDFLCVHVHEGTVSRQDLLLCLQASRKRSEPILQLFPALSALRARGQVCDFRIQIALVQDRLVLAVGHLDHVGLCRLSR